MLGIPAELLPYIVPLLGAVVGYFLRHWHVAIPFLPQSPNVTPANPTPAVQPNLLDELLKLLKVIQNPTLPAQPVAGVNISTATHDVVIDEKGTNVIAK